MTNVIVKNFGSYNFRRYGTPWVCKMTQTGKYNFDEEIGTYTGNGRKGEEGDLVIFQPEMNQVYGYGQKDYRGNNTLKEWVKWNGKEFVSCDKLGKEER